MVSDLEMTSKTQLAFKALDKNSDGFISKREFNEISKSLTKEQVTSAMKPLTPARKPGTGDTCNEPWMRNKFSDCCSAVQV